MERVLIIGCGGAGKSRLAVTLGEKLGLPVHHLDSLFWKPGWVPSARSEFEETLKTILETDAWIMDGNFGGTLEMRIHYADTVIFLDLPTLTCLLGALHRFWQYRGRTRPDMTDGNNERLNLEFLTWIAFYRRTRRPGILAFLAGYQHEKHIITLKSRKSIQTFLEQVQSI